MKFPGFLLLAIYAFESFPVTAQKFCPPSYPSEVAANDHPFYQHVYLQKMPAAGGKPVVIAYVYGGQGSINTPSWSPDGTRVAFVSNSVVD